MPQFPRPPFPLRPVLAAAALAIALGGPSAARAQTVSTQDPAVLSATAQAYLRGQLADVPGKISITLDPVRAERLAACDALTPFISSPVRLRPRMSVGVRCTAPQTWTTYVQASVSVAGRYYVASRQINAGRVIGPADVQTRDADLATLSPGIITDAGHVIGMRAANRIATGQPIKAAVLRSAQAIERGQNVNIVISGKGFTVSGEGEALDNAAPGDRVQVRTASGQIVNGVVKNAGLVEIPL
ncbi:flagella basal body P-ring formation protein [Bordetella ansorpii]|uniref:Flagella basal body P-ring formation protein FlgA n=1 Tax=Bordetella ansorpii TaxID=288768 RepID=A0A157RRM2_9BORD|nr:flagellar basal body P-ring formation chaperone FlgA [Bordetella ansorpii]SAI60651.1 flagella basal body P-ring formation protein [Bordetella ansorpii]